MQFLGFLFCKVVQIAEALDRRGGKTKHRLISYFRSNTSAKNYRNWIMYVKIIASRRWDDFLRHGVILLSTTASELLHANAGLPKLKVLSQSSIRALTTHRMIMVALCNRADHYIFILFLSSSFFSSPNLSGRRLGVYHTSAHGVALARI